MKCNMQYSKNFRLGTLKHNPNNFFRNRGILNVFKYTLTPLAPNPEKLRLPRTLQWTMFP